MNTRGKYATRVMLFGLFCNILLATLKFFIGFASGSISIMADATNNLMDALSSLTSLVCLFLSGRKADKDHPYGHGRYEYLAGAFISVLVSYVGFSFLRDSLNRVLHPETVQFHIVFFLLLMGSIIIKAVMGVLYLKTSKRINSLTLKAAALDSFSDVAVTSVTAVAFLLSPVTSFPIDGIAGILVALFVLYGGVKMLAETLQPLLGKPGDPALISKILTLANSYDLILGVHDLLIHDYGPQTAIASLHAELPKDLTFVECHRCINELELEAQRTLGISLLVHADPVDVTDPKIQDLHLAIKGILKSLNPALSYHDLQINYNASAPVLELDLVIPYGASYDSYVGKAQQAIAKELQKTDPYYTILLHVDRSSF